MKDDPTVGASPPRQRLSLWEWTSAQAWLVAACLLTCSGCWLFPGKFERNEKVTLLRSERLHGGSRFCLSRPAVTPDGASVYFLRCEDPYSSNGTLWKMDMDGTDAGEVLQDTVTAFAVSSTGRYLVLAADAYGGTGRLLEFDGASQVLETLLIKHCQNYLIALTRTEPPTIYVASYREGVFRLNYDGTGETLISPTYEDFVNSEWADSVLLPWVTRDGKVEATAVPPVAGSDAWDIGVFEAGLGDTSLLRANPYRGCRIAAPSWTPDGNGLVYSASEYNRGLTMPLELWLLRPVHEFEMRYQ